MNKKEIIPFYKYYYKIIVKTIFYHIENWADAEDIAQEIFLDFSKQYKSIKKPECWLYKVTKNKIQRYYLKKEKSIETNEIIDNDITFSHSPEKKYIINMLLDKVLQKETSLNREIFLLKYRHKFNNGSICNEFNLTKSQLRFILDKVKKNIRYHFKINGIKIGLK